MEEIIMSEIFKFAFPNIWALLSWVILGKKVFSFVKNKYYNDELYEPDADTWICRTAFIATIVFMFFSIVDITGVAGLVAKWLFDEQMLAYLLSYPLRWAIAAVVDLVFCTIAWNSYLRHYIDRSIHA